MIILKTERLYLREFNEADFDSLHSIFSDAETMKYYPAPFTIEQTQNWIKRNKERYGTDGFGLWGICLRETHELIGDCGLVRQMVDGQDEVEIGYHINRNYWSKGFATEAANGCKEYGFRQLGLHKLISIIDQGNFASITVAEKIGFTKEKESYIFGKNHLIYSGFTSGV